MPFHTIFFSYCCKCFCPDSMQFFFFWPTYSVIFYGLIFLTSPRNRVRKTEVLKMSCVCVFCFVFLFLFLFCFFVFYRMKLGYWILYLLIGSGIKKGYFSPVRGSALISPQSAEKMTKISHFWQIWTFLPLQKCILPSQCKKKKKKWCGHCLLVEL